MNLVSPLLHLLLVGTVSATSLSSFSLSPLARQSHGDGPGSRPQECLHTGSNDDGAGADGLPSCIPIIGASEQHPRRSQHSPRKRHPLVKRRISEQEWRVATASANTCPKLPSHIFNTPSRTVFNEPNQDMVLTAIYLAKGTAVLRCREVRGADGTKQLVVEHESAEATLYDLGATLAQEGQLRDVSRYGSRNFWGELLDWRRWFDWRRPDPAGRLVAGLAEAGTLTDVLQRLPGRDRRPVLVTTLSRRGGGDGGGGGGGGTASSSSSNAYGNSNVKASSNANSNNNNNDDDGSPQPFFVGTQLTQVRAPDPRHDLPWARLVPAESRRVPEMDVFVYRVNTRGGAHRRDCGAEAGAEFVAQLWMFERPPRKFRPLCVS